MDAPKLLPCPFCGDKMEDRGYGAVHIVGKPCPIGDLAIDVERWNRRAASPEVAKLVADAEVRGWNNGMRIATSHVAEVRNTQKPGAVFAALNEAMGRIEGARFAAIRRAAEETGT